MFILLLLVHARIDVPRLFSDCVPSWFMHASMCPGCSLIVFPFCVMTLVFPRSYDDMRKGMLEQNQASHANASGKPRKGNSNSGKSRHSNNNNNSTGHQNDDAVANYKMPTYKGGRSWNSGLSFASAQEKQDFFEQDGCIDFRKRGYCKKGDECPYAHLAPGAYRYYDAEGNDITGQGEREKKEREKLGLPSPFLEKIAREKAAKGGGGGGGKRGGRKGRKKGDSGGKARKKGDNARKKGDGAGGKKGEGSRKKGTVVATKGGARKSKSSSSDSNKTRGGSKRNHKNKTQTV